MKFVKENMTLVICGAVVLLLLVFAFVPGIPYGIPYFRAQLVAEMQDRYNHISVVKGYAGETLSLQGVPPAKGIPTANWVEAKIGLIKDIHDQQTKVERGAREGNMRNRVENNLPLVNGFRLPNFLPKVDESKAHRLDFKSIYGQQFHQWTRMLAYGPPTPTIPAEVEDDAATPPKADKIKAEWDARQAAIAATLPPGVGGNPGMGLGGAVNPQAQAQYNVEAKRLVMNKAASLQMYVEPNAFQRRAWLYSNESPEDIQIFEAIVDGWFQYDVVKAIVAVNKETLDKNPKQHDVSMAPIKRLTRIVVGNNARTRYLNTGIGGAPAAGPIVDPGPLFFTSANANVQGGVPGASAMGPSVADSNSGVSTSTHPGTLILPQNPNTTDYNLGMTGRSAGMTYDVAYMSVVMDMDPAALFKFVDALYRQNMGYSVVGTQMRTVDPLERASNGYIYGESQVVEVELTIECILFRSWTEALMPDDEKRLLGGT